MTNKQRIQRTNEELCTITNRLFYEWQMLASSAEMLQSVTEQLIENSLIESCAIHSRALVKFLYPYESKRPPNPTDAIADDFFMMTSNKWRDACPKIPKELGYDTFVKYADKQIAHITYSDEDKHQWDFTAISNALQPVLEKFMGLPEHDLQGEFWPDGRPNRFNRPQALTLSGCFKAGAVTCTSCHVAHGSRNEFSLKVNIHQGRNGDALCTQCHTTPKLTSREPAENFKPLSPQALKPSFTGPGLEGHTFHKPDSAGSRCISCHMSDVNWRLLIRRRDHTFQPPVPENTTQFGIPNACTTCHDDRSPEWAAKQMNAWWNDGDRRSKSASLADTMYRAGSGDSTMLPALAKLAVDRSQGLLIRASAADFIGRLIFEWRTGGTARDNAPTQTSFDDGSTGGSTKGSTVVLRGTPGRRTTVEPSSNARRTDVEVRRTAPVVTPAIVNALIGAAADPEPVVRAAAVAALGTVGDRNRALAPVIARLVDPTRVVRAKAAEVLLAFGVAELPGQAGIALRRAQDDYLARLGAFPDIAVNHAARAWLESERDNAPAARAALENAIILDASYAYPWVIKGVLSAREGKFAEAVEMWKKARSIEPSYPNIDQLIAGAEKRK